jgi:Tfp pilus assembly PilM family ATPase
LAATETIIGLALTDKSVQAVEIEQEGASNTLLAIDEWENPLSFGVGGENDATAFDQFIEHLAEFVRQNHIRTRRVSVALDSSKLFLNTVPMEDGLSQTEANEQIAWELNQFYPGSQQGEFVTDTHVLSWHRTEGWNEVLCVSVRRDEARSLQRALVRAGLELQVVDVDHFAADTALRVNYPDTNRKFLALVGVKENRLDISLIKNGNTESYSYCVVQSDKEIVEQIGTLSRETKGIYSITAYGPYLSKDLLVQIRRGSSLLVEALNPLRHVKVSDTLRLSERLSVPSYRFASVVGVALRRD